MEAIERARREKKARQLADEQKQVREYTHWAMLVQFRRWWTHTQGIFALATSPLYVVAVGKYPEELGETEGE
jgi:hypothetical protein